MTWKMFRVWLDVETQKDMVNRILEASPTFPFCMNQYYGLPNERDHIQFRFPSERQAEAEEYLDERGFFKRDLYDWNEHTGTILNYVAATKAYLDLVQITHSPHPNPLQMLDFLHSLFNQCGYGYRDEITTYMSGRDFLMNMLGMKQTPKE